MAGYLILFVGALYLWTALDLFGKGQDGLSLAFAAYALSNVGLYFAQK